MPADRVKKECAACKKEHRKKAVALRCRTKRQRPFSFRIPSAFPVHAHCNAARPAPVQNWDRSFNCQNGACGVLFEVYRTLRLRMIRAARLEQFGAPPKQRFCCLRGKATRAGETDVSLQGNAASSPGGWEGSRNRAVSAGYCMLAFLPLEVRCRAIGQQGIRLQFCLQSEGGYGTLPVRYALLKNALARLGTCTFLCAQGKRSTRRKPARL